MADRKSKNVQPSAQLGDLGGRRPRRRGSTRTQRSSPGAMWLPTTASPSSSRERGEHALAGLVDLGASSAGGVVGASVSVGVGHQLHDNRVTSPAVGHVLVPDALLEQHDALEQGLGPGRAAGHVDVDGDDLVDALGDRVAVPVGAAAVGARAHGDHVLGVGHLLVEAPDGGGHLVGDRARDDDEVGLAGAGRQRDDAEAHDVVAGRAEGGAHLDGAAGQAPLVHPEASTCGRC